MVIYIYICNCIPYMDCIYCTIIKLVENKIKNGHMYIYSFSSFMHGFPVLKIKIYTICFF